MRPLRTALGLLAFALLIGALGDIVLHNAVTLMPTSLFGALVAVVLAFLLHEFMVARRRAELADRQAAWLKSASARLEQSLAAAAAFNAQLNQSEARYRALVDAQGDAIFRRAPDTRLTYGNDAFFKLFGLNPQSAIGRPFAPELHPESHASNFGSFDELKRGRVRLRYDQRVRTAYGWRWISWEDYAARDAQGRLIEVQSVGRDITERKALEDAVVEARDKAEEGSRAKSGFLATMSHEIRTPMNGVLGMARLLMETDLRPEQRTYVEAISKSGDALLSLIADILDFSKIESGTFTLAADEIELRALIESLIELYSPPAHEKNIELVVVIDPAVPEVIRSDHMRLRQALTNLVSNAVKFTQRGGVELRVGVVETSERRFLRFAVRDTGVGVPEEKRAEIFREFVQADSSHARKFGGSGLGLAISKKLVEAMGGEIGIDESPGGGSIFWFTLPQVVVKPASVETTPPLKDVCVAVVTSNPVLRDGLTAQILAAGGAMFAPGGTRAPNIMLVDAGTDSETLPPAMPDRTVPAIVLVTPSARSVLPAMRELGYEGYLVKPVRQATLIERLRQRSAAAPSSSPATNRLPPENPSDAARAREVRDGGRRLRILLAEDNPINLLLTRELLRRRGHDVIGVASGEAMVRAMQDSEFDIALTDIHMPGMDGIEATQVIRTYETAAGKKRTPIVALTADALETGKRACKDAGMDGFLTKPVDPAQLDDMFAIFFPNAAPFRSSAA